MLFGIIALSGAGLLWCLEGVCYEWIPAKPNAVRLNMLTGAVFSNLLLWTLFCPGMASAREIAIVAAFLLPAGIAYLLSVAVLKKAMENGSAGSAWCIMQAAMICPLLTMVIFFGEKMTPFSSLGILSLFAGLSLFGVTRNAPSTSVSNHHWKFIIWASLAFLLTGLQQTCAMLPSKIAGLSENALSWRVPLMKFSTMLWLVPCIAARCRPRRREWIFGVCFGVVSSGGELLFFLGVDHLNRFNLAGLTYPLALSISIVLFTFYCRFYRQRKFSKVELAAIGTTVLGILMLSC